MKEKYIGYILLLIGIYIMGFAIVSMYMVFIRHVPPLQVFSFQSISLDANKLIPSSALMPPSSQQAKIDIFPAEILNRILNTAAHVIFMGFLVTVGYHIANLGTSLMRPIIVKVHRASLPVDTQEQPEEEPKKTQTPPQA